MVCRWCIGFPLAIQRMTRTLRQSIDYALEVQVRSWRKGGKTQGKEEERRNRKQQFVACIDVVKGVPFYGYNAGWQLYCKISLFNPSLINCLARLLTQGTIMQRVLQPYEAHINYKMQFMTDFNLYGCGNICCDEAGLSYRRRCRSRGNRVENSNYSDTDDEMDFGHVDDNYGDILPENEFPTHSYSGWEVDIQCKDILNRLEIKQRNHHDRGNMDITTEEPVGFKYLHSLDELWKAHGRQTMSQDTAGGGDDAAAGRGTQSEWIQEAEFRAQINSLIRKDGRVSGFDDILRDFSHKDHFMTAFESVESMCANVVGVAARAVREDLAVLEESDGERGTDVDMDEAPRAESEEYLCDELSFNAIDMFDSDIGALRADGMGNNKVTRNLDELGGDGGEIGGGRS